MDTLHAAPAPMPAAEADVDDCVVILGPVHCVHCPDHPEQDLDLCTPDDLDPSRLVGVCHLCPLGSWFRITFEPAKNVYVNHGRLEHSASPAVSPAA